MEGDDFAPVTLEDAQEIINLGSDVTPLVNFKAPKFPRWCASSGTSGASAALACADFLERNPNRNPFGNILPSAIGTPITLDDPSATPWQDSILPFTHSREVCQRSSKPAFERWYWPGRDILCGRSEVSNFDNVGATRLRIFDLDLWYRRGGVCFGHVFRPVHAAIEQSC